MNLSCVCTCVCARATAKDCRFTCVGWSEWAGGGRIGDSSCYDWMCWARSDILSMCGSLGVWSELITERERDTHTHYRGIVCFYSRGTGGFGHVLSLPPSLSLQCRPNSLRKAFLLLLNSLLFGFGTVFTKSCRTHQSYSNDGLFAVMIVSNPGLTTGYSYTGI